MLTVIQSVTRTQDILGKHYNIITSSIMHMTAWTFTYYNGYITEISA